MATPSTMIIAALQKIGEKSLGATLTSDEQTAYLERLNSMMESWSLERLMCYQLLEESKALTSSVGSYTIGSGGAFNTTRPNKIESAWIRDASGFDTPLTILNAEQYNRITDKTVDGTYPEYLYYDAAYSSGLATIYLYPEPAAGLTLYISSWKQLQTFAAIGTTVTLPPGYQRAIEFNLAIELAGGFITPDATVVKIARDSKAAIKGINSPEVIATADAFIAGHSRGNIFTGP